MRFDFRAWTLDLCCDRDQEGVAVTNLVTKAQAVFDNLIVNPGNFDACVSRQYEYHNNNQKFFRSEAKLGYFDKCTALSIYYSFG